MAAAGQAEGLAQATLGIKHMEDAYHYSGLMAKSTFMMSMENWPTKQKAERACA